FQKNDDVFPLVEYDKSVSFLIDTSEDKGVLRAIRNLQSDVEKVTGIQPGIIYSPDTPEAIIIGSMQNSRWIKQLIEDGKINDSDLRGKREKYIISTVQNPLPGVKEALVIAGSD